MRKAIGFLVVVGVVGVFSSHLHGQSVPPSSFSFFRQIIIDHRQVPDSDQTDFPLLVSLTLPDLATVVNGGQVQNANGYDIVFTADSAGQTKLDHEIDKYSASNGAIAFWVRIPTLSHSTDTSIFMWYGSSVVVSSQENKAGVWRNGYAAVWHLGNGTTLSTSDSTGVNSGTASNVTASNTAKIGGAASFPGGSSTYIDISNNPQVKPTSALTVEAWAYPNALNNWQNIVALDYHANGSWVDPQESYGLYANGSSSVVDFVITGGNGTDVAITGTRIIPLSQWTHLAGTYDGTTLHLYENGVAEPASRSVAGPISYGSSKDLTLGTSSRYCCPTGWNGNLDEVRISSVARTADWIATEFNNQNSPANFFQVCAAALSGNTPPSCVISPPPSSYSFFRQIVIDHRQVSNTDQVDFPVLISTGSPDMALVTYGGEVLNSKGYDVVFTSDALGQSQLDHEIDSYDPATGNANFWVRIPSLSHTSDTSIYMWYGNSAVVLTQENKSGVWRNGYAAVWHFGDGNSLSTTDSASANVSRSSNVNPSQLAKVGGSASFNGATSTYIDVSGTSAVKPTSALTLEGWIYPNTMGSGASMFGLDYRADGTWNSPWSSYTIGSQNPTPAIGFNVTGSNGTSVGVNGTRTIPLSQWTQVVGTFDGTTLRLYENGVAESVTATTSGPISYGTSKDLVLGNDSIYQTCCPAPWNGLLDELRISNVARSADWIATQYNNQSSPATFSMLCGQTVAGNQGPPCSVPVGPSSFAFSRAITISHLNVPNTDQTDFPILVSGVFPFLAWVGNGGQVQSNHGYDIVFSSDAAGQTQLDHEIDFYDPLTGTASFWVRIPTLSHTVDTTIYMWYGNSSVVLTQENKTGVWRNGYAAVWHFGNGNTLSATDSAGSNNGTPVNVSASSVAKIGGAASFPGGSNAYIDIPNSPQVKPSSALTVEAWAYPNSLGNWQNVLAIDYHANGSWTSPAEAYGMYANSPSSVMDFGLTGGNGTAIGITGTRTIPLSQWTHLVGTYDGTTLRLYENGVVDPANATIAGPITYGTSQDLTLGINSKYLSCCATGWSGLLDELRISSVARSADWIAAEYNNQNLPSTFYSIGQENANYSGLNPVINGLIPDVGRPGMAIRIAGAGFGEIQGSGSVTFNGTEARINSWSYGSIISTVPQGATSGPLVVTTSQQTSAQVPFTILPAGQLTETDIGTVSSPGSSSLNNGVYTVTTTGSDVWGTADSTTFLYQEWSGDFDVMVRVTSQQNTSASAKAGIMVRESLNASARNVFAFLTPGAGAEIEWRLTPGASEANDSGVSSAHPYYWIRLMRRGNAFAGLGSPDGRQWFALGSKTVVLPNDVYVGIAQTTGGGAANTSTYDNYTAQSSAFTNDWREEDIGSLSTPGVSVFDGTSFFVHTTGADIWTTSDPGEHFIFQPWTGDFDIKVHVDSQQNTGNSAKFGLIARESLSPNAANVLAYITPGLGSGMEWRPSTGANEILEGGVPTAPAPGWLRLIRRGNNFSSYWSPDGSTWTTLGAKTLGLLSTVYLGLAATDDYTSWAADVADSLQVASPTAPAGVQAPWAEADIGSVPSAGSSSFDGLSTVVLSTGYDIWSPPDTFHYIYQSVSGDLDAVARVTHIEDTQQNAKSGLMVRQSLVPSDVYFFTDDTFSSGVFPQWRYTSGSVSSNEASAPGAVRPYWVRVVRRGNTFWSYGSTSGTSWALLAQQNIQMTGSVLVGIATTTGMTNGVTNNSTFDSLALRATSNLTAVPLVSSITPPSAGPLAQLTVQGSGFGTPAGSVLINGVPANVLTWNNGTITLAAPQPAPTGPVLVIAADGTNSNSDVLFTGINPVVASVTPTSGAPGDRVTVYGTGFGQQQGTLTFNGTSAVPLVWQADHVVAYVPAGAQTGPVQVTEAGVNSNSSVTFTVVAPQGSTNGVTYTYDVLGRLASVIDNSSGQAAVYSYDAVGNILSISRNSSNAPPLIASFSPPSGAPAAEVTIVGTNFSSTASQNTVSFNGTVATVYRATATSLLVSVPSGATSGPITVSTSQGSAASSSSFNVLTPSPGPVIYSFSPNIVAAGTAVTITGSNFDPNPANDHLNVAGRQITPTSATAASLTFTVPAGAGSGTIALSTGNGYTLAPGDLYVVPPGYAPSSVGFALRSSSSSIVTTPVPVVGQIGLLIFDALAGHNLAVNTQSSTFSGCNWQLFRPDAVSVNSSQAGCTTANPFLDAQPLALNGTYTFVIAPVNTAGAATLQLYDSVNVTGTLPTDGTSVSVSTPTPGQNGQFTFSIAPPNEHLIWYVTSTTYPTSPGCMMTIYNPDGSQYSNSFGGGGTNGTLSCSAVGQQDLWYFNPGTYSLKFNPALMSTGSATFNLINAPDVFGTTSIGSGAQTTSTTIPGQNIFLNFPGTASQQITLQSSVSIGTNHSAWISITRVSDGLVVFNGYTVTTGSPQSHSGITLPTTDTYRVNIFPGVSAGSVTITLTSP